ncbi:hypothetical protein HMPREF3196_01011 [Bifidobacterium bifidum]|uniref:Uncharacterized protein n=1 Tax=Bifidobacterium bifidum TaxID=1681 RepID=A0A133KPW3_BIFBI|nr:hypothetical protein HMPREF3196_01011 [Bifidobacterium bifidum]
MRGGWAAAAGPGRPSARLPAFGVVLHQRQRTSQRAHRDVAFPCGAGRLPVGFVE